MNILNLDMNLDNDQKNIIDEKSSAYLVCPIKTKSILEMKKKYLVESSDSYDDITKDELDKFIKRQESMYNYPQILYKIISNGDVCNFVQLDFAKTLQDVNNFKYIHSSFIFKIKVDDVDNITNFIIEEEIENSQFHFNLYSGFF